MKKVWKNYKMMLLLLGAITLGVFVGLYFKEDVLILKPLGDLFLNLLFVLIVPLVFLTITTSIARMNEPKRLSKIMFWIVLVFIITSLVSVFIGLISTLPVNLISTENGAEIKHSFVVEKDREPLQLNLLERTVEVLTVSDFKDLLSKDHMIALVVISILVGLAVRHTKKKGEAFYHVLVSMNEVVLTLVKFVMYYAPIGLGCYIASFVGTFGAGIAVGYIKTFIIYTMVSILFYFLVYSFYAYLAGGKKGVIAFFKYILTPTCTALATCSSAACIPVNTEASKRMGVSSDIADTMIPLGTSFHKDGSIIGSVFKIMFLVCLFESHLDGALILQILGVALLANLLVTAVPIGGGTISEMLIITMMGYPIGALPILTIIATIIDAPATVLNVVGDSASSMLVARAVDGKDWMKEKLHKEK